MIRSIGSAVLALLLIFGIHDVFGHDVCKQDLHKALIELQNLYPEHEWSPAYTQVCNDLASEQALDKAAAQEVMNECAQLTQTADKFIESILEQLMIYASHDEQEQDTGITRSGRAVIDSLVVRETLRVSGPTIIEKSSRILGDQTIVGNLSVQGDVTVNSTIINQGSQNIIGDLTVSGNETIGGTSTIASLAAGAVVSNNAGLLSSTAGTAGQVLTSNGPGVAPTFQFGGGGGGIAALQADSGTATGATVTLAGGNNIGTSALGSTVTFHVDGTTNNAVQVGNASGSLTSLAVGSNGQVLIGANSASPAFATLTSGNNSITFTPGANTLDLQTSSATANSFVTGLGTATPALGVLSVPNSSNINTAGLGNTLTISLVNSPSVSGSLTAGTSVAAGTTVTAGTGITATTGNIAASSGNVTASGLVSAGTSVSAGTTVTAGTGITATTGNITASSGNVTASGLVSAGTSLAAGTTITAGTGITATTGDIAASSGNITASGTVTAGTGITSTTGNITAASGNLVTTNGSASIGSTAAAATASNVNLIKSRTGGVITSGDTLGTITFQGNDGTSNVTGSQISSVSSGTVATNRIASDLRFFTHPDSTTASTQRMSIGSAGNVTIATPDSGVGLTISGGGLTTTGATTLSSLTAGVLSANGSGVVASNATTNNAVQVGNASGTLTSLAVGSNGQVLIGANSASPAFATLTSTGGTITFTAGANTLNLETSGATANSFVTGLGTATPALGVLSVPNSSNINTAGSGNTLTISLVNSPSVSGSVTAGTGITATTGNIAASSGNVTASGLVSSGTSMSAGTTLTAGTGITLTSGVLQIPAGTTAVPSLNFAGSTTTGLSASAGALSLSTSAAERMKISSAGTISVNGFTSAGVVHNDASGNLSTSLIVNADISNTAAITDGKLATISTSGKVSNSATTATALNTASAIVARDGSGNFAAGTITASLTGAASLNVLKAGDTMTGALQLPAGTTAVPSLNFTGSTTTGLSAASNALSLSTAATERINIGSTGLVTITGLNSSGVVHTNGSGTLSTSQVVNGDIADGTIANVKLATASSSNNPNYIVIRDSSGNFITTMITLTGSVTNPTDAATKAYVDSVAGLGLNVKDPAEVVSTTNVALSGLQTIDGVVLVDGNRVLLTGQTDPVENGLWVAHSGAWTRPADFSSGTAPIGLVYVLVLQGNTYGGSSWITTTPDAVVGTDPIGFTLFSSPSQTTAANVGAGAGQVFRDKTGNTLNLRTINAGAHITVDTDSTLTNTVTVATDATSANTASTSVARDGSGNFAAGTITASLTGAASLNVLKAGDTMTGNLNMAAQTEVRLQDAAGGQYIGLNAPTTVPTSYTLSLPSTVPTAAQTLQANSVTPTNLEWITPGGSQQPTASRTIFVTKYGNDTTGNGSLTAPYASLAKAIDIANGISSVSNPVTIFVASGSYTEDNSAGPLQITAGGISIVGDSTTAAIISPSTLGNDLIQTTVGARFVEIGFVSGGVSTASALVFAGTNNTSSLNGVRVLNFSTGIFAAGTGGTYVMSNSLLSGNSIGINVNDATVSATGCILQGSTANAIAVTGSSSLVGFTAGTIQNCNTAISATNNSRIVVRATGFRNNLNDVIQSTASISQFSACTFQLSPSSGGAKVQVSDAGTLAELLGCFLDGADSGGTPQGTCALASSSGAIVFNGGQISNFVLGIQDGLSTTDTSATSVQAIGLQMYSNTADIAQAGLATLTFNGSADGNKITVADSTNVTLVYSDSQDNGAINVGNFSNTDTTLLHVATGSANDPHLSYKSSFYSTQGLGYQNPTPQMGACSWFALASNNESSNLTAVTTDRAQTAALNLYSDTGSPVGTTTALRGWNLTKAASTGTLVFGYQNSDATGQSVIPLHTVMQLDGVNNAVQLTNSAASTASNTLDFQKSRSGGVITSGDTLGTITFQGNDGTSNVTGSQIRSVSSGTVATNRVASDLRFFTHPDSTTASTQRMSIGSAGNVTIATPDSGVGLTISGGGLTTTGTTTLSSLTAGVLSANGSGVVSSNATTNNAVQVGNASGTLTSLAVGSNGQVLIGANSASPAFATLTSTGGTITFTAGANTLNLETSGATANSFVTGLGTATPALGVLSVPNSSNINTAGSGNTLTISLVNSPSVSGSLTAGSTVTAGTGITATTGNVTISAGNLALPNTNSAGTQGVITFGGSPFISKAGTFNTFIGINAGNTTLTGNSNTALGASALQAVTTGTENTAIGRSALVGLLTDSSNTAVGILAGSSINGGSSNTLIGSRSGALLTTGNNNVALGANALGNLATGVFNIAIGNTTNGYTGAESSNILIGNSGTLGESNVIRIGTNGTGTAQQNQAFIAGTVTAAAGLVATTTVTGGTGITATTGNIAASSGNVTASGLMSAGTSVSAGTTVTAGTGITATTGNIAASSGNVTASGSVTGGTGVTATTGNVTISAGNLALPNTNGAGTQGEITFGGSRFISNFGTNNTFVGSGSGNTTLTGTGNTALGASALAALTGGTQNVAIGQNAALGSTADVNNTVVGALACFALNGGSDNTVVGRNAAVALSTGGSNTALGSGALSGVTTGTRNIAIGLSAGSSYATSDSSNIVIGNSGTAAESNTIRIGTNGSGTGQQNQAFIAGTVTAAAGLVATTTVTAGTGITATTGNIAASSGNITASGSITSGTNIVAGAGLTVSSLGALISGNISQNSGSVTMGADNTDNAINLGTAASAGRTITIGNTTGTSGIVQRVGTGNYSLDGAAGSTYTVGASTTTGTITIGGTAQTGTMTLGSSSGTNTLAIAAGAGATAVQIANAQNGGSVSIGAAMTTGTISIGGTGAQTGAITLGSSTGTNTVNVGTGTGTTTVNIGTGATNTKTINIGSTSATSTINIGTGSGANNVTIGSTNSGSSLIMRTGGSNLLLLNGTFGVSSTGTMTNSAQPAFFAYKSAASSNVTGNNTTYTIIFDTELFDTGSNYNNSTGVFTAPATGVYAFSSAANLTSGISSASVLGFRLATPGRNYTYGLTALVQGSSGVSSVGNTWFVKLTAGDTVSITINISGNGSNNVTVNGAADAVTYFCGYLVA